MRDSICMLLIAIGFTNPSAAETEPSSPPTKSPSQVDIAELNGAELFDHQWTHKADAQRKPVATVSKEDADQDSLASRSQAQRSAAQSGVQRRSEEQLDVSNAILEQRLALLRGRLLRGKITNVWSDKGDGLGPLHNATSCADCHPSGGAAGVEHNVTLITVDPRSKAVTFATDEHAQQLFDVFPGLLNEDGNLTIETVVHDRSTNDGYGKIRNQLAHYVPGGIDDAWFMPEKRTSKAIAERPVIAGRHDDVDFYLSQRNPPPLFGLGLIDRIPRQRLVWLAEHQEKTTEGGVTGRVAMKFGWRGQIGSVSAFVSQACAGELGLTQMSALQPGDPANLAYTPPGLDMTYEDVFKLTRFVSSLPLPIEGPQEHHSEDDVFDGESVFYSIGCGVCHVPDVRPVRNLFSDLLLHDMGAGLQAASPAPSGSVRLAGVLALPRYQKRGPFSGASPPYYSGSTSQGIPIPEPMTHSENPQFPRGPRQRPAKARQADDRKSPADDATEKTAVTWDDLQREWRTPPLWGIADTAPYLHDGRAETLEAAILWHGGEAQESRDLFAGLKSSEKEQLLAFLSSLRAPKQSNLVKQEIP
jgi:CxxC motif-containing protein (DUF1111 family)